jgi:uncharacterized protein YbaP (TraB family)
VRRALAALALALLAACGSPARDWPEPRPALWEVSGPHGERGWLFGTIHALPDGVAWETPRFDAAFGQAGVLVVEIANLSDRAGSTAFERAATSPGLPPLLQRMPAEDRPAVAGAMRRAGYSEEDFARYETWAVAVIIANGTRAGKADNGIDLALLDRAKPVEGLETFAGQFAIFDRLAPPDQAELLREVGEHAPEDERTASVAWLTGDLETLSRTELAGVLADPELRRALVVDRNRAWAAHVAALLDSGRRPFVAVGAGHMIGDIGLPALLAARGYTVRRIQ